MQQLLDALDEFRENTSIIFTMPNADAEGRTLMEQVKAFVASRPHTRVFTSLGQINYLSLAAQVDAVVGNSSSGLYEAPTLKVPTVNIGDRQKGRLQASSVINSPVDRTSIIHAIHRAYELDASGTVNPYGDGSAAKQIVAELSRLTHPESLLQKHFFTPSIT
jgi:UDP-N-acetylglucosamine 2-epimerase (non-hydrolysing)/GDP/UDP-N,N'-diacetylbacillosamine 2-epimerase (hydrolysing)